MKFKKSESLYIALTAELMNKLTDAYDVFTRCDLHDEVILDASCFDDDDIRKLSRLLGFDASEAANHYIIAYIGQPEDEIESDDCLSKDYVKRGGCTCLICKDDSIEGGSIQTDSGIAWQKVWCNSCGSEWTDNYKLVSTSDLSMNVPFHLGQEVQWADPDADSSSGVYTVKSIEAEDVVIIVNESGSESEVPVSELKAVDLVVHTQESANPGNELQEKKYLPAIVESFMQDLTEAGTVFSGETKPVDIKLAALTRLEYMETVLVPVEFGGQQLEELVDRTYDAVDGGDYWDDPDYWERGTCSHQISDSRTAA